MELLTTNNVWMMVCTFLVFFMHLGFSFLEIGLTQQKNTVNILFKNFFVITAGILIYYLVGLILCTQVTLSWVKRLVLLVLLIQARVMIN